MSLIHLKRLLASFMLVTILATQATAAQGFRPWAPYQRDEFGGGARRAEGVYGILEGVYYSFAPTKNIVVGDVSHTQGKRAAFTGDATINQTNTVNTNNLGAPSALGVRAEVGNMRGHHGWSVSGYNLSNMNSSAETPDASVVINDECGIDAYTVRGADLYFYYVWNPGSPKGFDEVPSRSIFGDGPITGATSLWGWFIARWAEGETGDPVWNGRLAPLPVNFETAKVTTRIDHWAVEALYTYRCHPSRFGNLDLFGGVRYMEINDSLNFLGEGVPWKGVTVVEDSEDGELEGNAFGVGSILGDSDWKFKAGNHIVAPMVGARLAKTNNRWTFSAEGTFMAGLNQQNLRSQGTLGSHYDNINETIFDTDLLPTTVRDYGIYPWTPIGIVEGMRSFNHSAVRHAFSPGVEVKLNANWQLTHAVGVNVGVTGMWVDDIARGSKINNYTIFNNGQFFGLNKSGYTDSALMYGVNFGVTVNRF